MKMLCLASDEEEEDEKARKEWNETKPNNNNESTPSCCFERTEKVALEFLTILVWVPRTVSSENRWSETWKEEKTRKTETYIFPRFPLTCPKNGFTPYSQLASRREPDWTQKTTLKSILY